MCDNGELRDVIALVNSSGDIVVRYTYDSWGKVLSVTGSMASTLGALNPFRYRGYYYDVETGLYYLKSRYYNPEWGRMLNPDNYIFKEGSPWQNNLFVYCANAPIDYYDPTGHSLRDIIDEIVDYCLYRESRIIWSFDCLALESQGMHYSSTLLNNANQRKPENMIFDSESELSRKISLDTEFLKALKEAINNGNDTFNVKFEKDRDLFGAIHDSSFLIKDISYDGDKLAYKVELTDKYDFSEYKIDFMKGGVFYAIAWIGNDLAYMDMNIGALNDYRLFISIEGVLP